MAHAVMAGKVADAGLADQIVVDSAGTGNWHAGESPHRGTLKVLAEHGYATDHLAREVMASELASWDYIVAMDAENVAALRQLGAPPARLRRLLDFAFDADDRDVPDPYYTGRFGQVFDLVDDGTQGLLDAIRERYGL